MSGSQYFNTSTRTPYAVSAGYNQYNRNLAGNYTAIVGAGEEYWDRLQVVTNNDILGTMTILSGGADGFIAGNNYILQCEKTGLYFINIYMTYINLAGDESSIQLETTLGLRRKNINGTWNAVENIQNSQLALKPAGENSRTQSHNMSVMINLNAGDRITLLLSNKSEVGNNISIINANTRYTTQLIM